MFQLKTGCPEEGIVLCLVVSGAPFCSAFILFSLPSPFIVNNVALIVSTAAIASYVVCVSDIFFCSNSFKYSFTCYSSLVFYSFKYFLAYVMPSTYDTMYYHLLFIKITLTVAINISLLQA